MSTETNEPTIVPMIDPKLAYEELREATDRAVLDVLRSGQYVLGERVATFEKEVASYIGTSDAIGVSSGTEALLLALQALDVGPNDEVVTTSFSFIASATCIARLGARPVFVDIDPVTYQMDPDALAAAVSPRTRAIIAVHLYGYPAPMTRYLDIANSQDEPIAVIEDAAQAIGTVCDVESLRGPRYQKAGSIGLFGCFSFYPTKNLPACGEAGLLTTSQPYQAERARQLRVHGMDDEYHHVLLSGNGRLDALQAAILSVRLAHLDRWNQRYIGVLIVKFAGADRRNIVDQFEIVVDLAHFERVNQRLCIEVTDNAESYCHKKKHEVPRSEDPGHVNFPRGASRLRDFVSSLV